MNDPSDELRIIRQELEQFRQDFSRYQKGLGNQITLGIVGGGFLLAVIVTTLQIISAVSN